MLFGPEEYDASYNRIEYLIRQKSGIVYDFFHNYAKSGVMYDFFHNYAKIKIDSYDYLALEKTLNLHIVIILIKSVLNKDQNHYY